MTQDRLWLRFERDLKNEEALATTTTAKIKKRQFMLKTIILQRF